MSTFLFYDLETTGLDPVFDQILQFAAIRTDEALKPLSDPVNWFVRLRPDVIPSPAALLKTHRTVASLVEGRPEVEVMRDIHALVNQPGTVSIGYNSLEFDDDFLRFGFYRNLLPPYSHQGDNDCGRADLLAILLRFRHYDEAALIWPVLDDGPTLKLEHLAVANGCDDGAAHDALADVHAAVNVARLLRKREESWGAALAGFSVPEDRATRDGLPRLSKELPFHRKGILLSARCGKQCLYAAPVLLVGESATYRKQTYWFRLDDPKLCDRLQSEPPERVWRRKKWGETPLVVPLDRVQLSREQRTTAQANVAWLKAHPNVLARLRQSAWKYRYPEVDCIDEDAQIYRRGFPNPEEKAAHRAFLAADPQEKPEHAAKLAHPVDRALAHRLLWRNYGWRGEETACLRPLLDGLACKDYRGGLKRTRAGALAEIDRLAAENAGDEDALRHLREIAAWLARPPAR